MIDVADPTHAELVAAAKYVLFLRRKGLRLWVNDKDELEMRHDEDFGPPLPIKGNIDHMKCVLTMERDGLNLEEAIFTLWRVQKRLQGEERLCG